MPSYSDLQKFRQCPRLWAFTQLGYKPLVVKEPLATGSLVHAGIAAHFRGQNSLEAMEKLLGDFGLKAPSEALKRSKEMLQRYLTSWANDFKAVLVETTLEIPPVIAHPDLIAYMGDNYVVVDYKTSHSGDTRRYDLSGQVDLYAWMLEEADQKVDMVIYDIISDDGFYRHVRPPRLDGGHRLFQAIVALSHIPQETAMKHPHAIYTCPSRCDYFSPCWMLETGTWQDAWEYLESNYVKEEGNV